MPSRVPELLAMGGMTMRFFVLIFFTESGESKCDNVPGSLLSILISLGGLRRPGFAACSSTLSVQAEIRNVANCLYIKRFPGRNYEGLARLVIAPFVAAGKNRPQQARNYRHVFFRRGGERVLSGLHDAYSRGGSFDCKGRL